MKILDVKRPSEDFGPLTHPILWWRNHCNKLNERRRLFSTPYTIQLPILPSYLYFCWQEKALQHKSLFMENRTLRYHDEKDRFFFSASLEVDRWQGVFVSMSPTEKIYCRPLQIWSFGGLPCVSTEIRKRS